MCTICMGGPGPKGHVVPIWGIQFGTHFWNRFGNHLGAMLAPILGTIITFICLYEMVRYTWYVIRNSLQVAQNWRAIVILLSGRSLSSGANNVSHHSARKQRRAPK